METENTLNLLQKTFGEIPQSIRDNLKYFKYSDETENFTCNICDDRTVKLYDNSKRNTTVNFMKHLESRKHSSKAVSQVEIWNRLTATFQNSIPKLVQQNAHILGTSNDDYYCEICEKTLEVSTRPSVTEATFAQHFLTDHRHPGNLKTYNDNVGLLAGIYGSIPWPIYHNSQYLRRATDGKNYFCTICKVVLRVYQNDLEKTEELFKNHLETEPHLSNTQQARATSRIPLLRQIYNSSVPLYVLKNIEYLSVNQTALYCSLCNASFEFSQANAAASKESLKQHIFSQDHENALRNRRDQDDEDYSKLSDLIDDFDQNFLGKLDCISTYEDKFVCKICNVYINEDMSSEDLEDDIEGHLNSRDHEEKFSDEMDRQSELLNDLNDLFGVIPERIENELSQIEYKGQGIDFKCTLCERKILKAYKSGDYEKNTYVTEENFYKHFDSDNHSNKAENFDSWNDKLENHFESLFSPSPIPQYVWNNLDSLGYDGNNDENDFCCLLCHENIDIARGPKAKELTIMNLNKHLLSLGHLTQLKNKSYKKYVAKSWLKSIFGGVSNLILNNIEHLEQYEGHFYCKICEAQILTGYDAEKSKKNFHSHLEGASHQSRLRFLEDNYEKATNELEDRFWFIPECLLKNMDFVSVLSDEEIYCEPCQETFALEKDVSKIHALRYHFESKDHEHNVGIY